MYGKYNSRELVQIVNRRAGIFSRAARLKRSDAQSTTSTRANHLRILLESEGACLLIRLGGLEWAARLTAAHNKLSHIQSRVWASEDRSPLFPLWTQAELEFHETFISSCDSDVLKASNGIIYCRFHHQLINTDKEYISLAEKIQDYKGILDARLERNKELIKQRVFDHLSRNFCKPMPPVAFS